MRRDDRLLTYKAKSLRQSNNPFEKKLWFYLRGKQLGHRFRRQHPIDPYIVDFICVSKNLIIEVDGISHDSKGHYDDKRQAFLESQGYHVIRFTTNDIADNIDGVVALIRDWIDHNNG